MYLFCNLKLFQNNKSREKEKYRYLLWKNKKVNKIRTGKSELEIGPVISINIVKINGLQNWNEQFPIFILYIYIYKFKIEGDEKVYMENLN